MEVLHPDGRFHRETSEGNGILRQKATPGDSPIGTLFTDGSVIPPEEEILDKPVEDIVVTIPNQSSILIVTPGNGPLFSVHPEDPLLAVNESSDMKGCIKVTPSVLEPWCDCISYILCVTVLVLFDEILNVKLNSLGIYYCISASGNADTAISEINLLGSVRIEWCFSVTGDSAVRGHHYSFLNV